VKPGAPWCTLCYADLRVPAEVSVPAEPVSVSMGAPVSVPAVAETLAPDPYLDAPVMAAPPVARAEPTGWPCTQCGARVPLADDACGTCGAPFLPTDTMPSLALPVVGDLSRLDRGQKIAATVVLALVVTAALVALISIAGSIL
jgi:hypothetical protein